MGPVSQADGVEGGAKSGHPAAMDQGSQRQFPKLNLVERDTGCIYARFVAGRLLWIDADVLAGASIDAETHAARYAAAPEIFSVPWPRHGLA